MTNFDAETRGDLIISETEATEIAQQLSVRTTKGVLRKQQQLDEVEETSIAYDLQKLNDIMLAGADRSSSSSKRAKCKLMDVEQGTSCTSSSLSSESSSYETNNEICELTREFKSMQFAAQRLKPIITFTPVNSAEVDEEEDHHCSPVSSPPFFDRPSSRSSSPMLEVPPICTFRDMNAEMMRPPLNSS